MTEGFKDKPFRIDPRVPDGFIYLMPPEDKQRFAMPDENWHFHGVGEDTGLRWTPAENVRGVTVEHEADRGDGISRGKIIIRKPD